MKTTSSYDLGSSPLTHISCFLPNNARVKRYNDLCGKRWAQELQPQGHLDHMTVKHYTFPRLLTGYFPVPKSLESPTPCTQKHRLSKMEVSEQAPRKYKQPNANTPRSIYQTISPNSTDNGPIGSNLTEHWTDLTKSDQLLTSVDPIGPDLGLIWRPTREY